MLTLEQLRKIMRHAPSSRLAPVVPILNAVAKAYEINTERRMAAWLATLAVESGEFKYQEEIASGAAYEGRKDLGNTQKGDGRRFKGHGRIQITGRANHQSYTNYLKKSGHLPFVDFTVESEKLAQEPYATDSAGWFWAKYAKLNGFADRGDFLTTQTRVNGRNKKTGLPNHWRERSDYFARALSVLPDGFTLSTAAEPTGNASDDAPIAQDTPSVTSNEPAQTQLAQSPSITSDQPQDIDERKKTGIMGKATAFFTALFTGTYIVPEWVQNGFTADTVKTIFQTLVGFRYVIGGIIVVVFIMRKYESIEMRKKQMEINADPTKGNINLNAPVKAWWQIWK